MSTRHRWIGGQCVKCGLLRQRKTRKILMAITHHSPYDHYIYEPYFEYNDGFKKMDKRPGCKPNIKRNL